MKNIKSHYTKPLFSYFFIILFSLVLNGNYSFAQKIDPSEYEQFVGPNFKSESKEDFSKRMKWFGEAKLGMFIHFGLYSHLSGYWKGGEVPGNITEWIWARIPGVDVDFDYNEYIDITKVWNPKDFDAEKVTDLAVSLGMKYITLTTKHHEGFCLWPSEYTEFDIENTPMKGRDIVKEISEACKRKGLKFGAYYSIPDWYYTIKEKEAKGVAKKNHGGGFNLTPLNHEEYFTYMKNQLKELITKYDPDLVWFDGDWLKTLVTPERSYKLYEFLRETKPSLIVNERAFSRRFDIPKKDFFNKEGSKITEEEAKLQENPETRKYYEYCTSIQHSWGHDDRKVQGTNSKYTHPSKLINAYAMMRKVGGNFLLNFGPDKTGQLDPLAIEVAKDFYDLTKKLDAKNDYSQGSVKSVLSSSKVTSKKYLNPDHYANTDPQKFKEGQAEIKRRKEAVKALKNK